MQRISFALALLLSLPATAQIAGTSTLPYQGRLESSGAAVTDVLSLSFTLRDASGTLTETVTLDDVAVNDGAFAVNAGPFSNNLLAQQPLYLSISVDGADLAGEQRLWPVPSAIRADAASDLTVLGTLDVGESSVVHNLYLGDVGFGGDWAGVRHEALSAATDYALVQNSTGSETSINTAAGGALKLRQGGGTRVLVDGGTGRVGINTADQTPGGMLEVDGADVTALRLRNPSSPGYQLRLVNDAAGSFEGGIVLDDSGFLRVSNVAADPNGNYARLSSGGNWTAVSDRRRKKAIRDAEPLLATALALRPVRFQYRNGTAEQQLGLIAQEVQPLLPSLVVEGDILTLNYSALSVVAIGALQELKRQHDEELGGLHRDVATVEGRLAKAEAENAALRARLERLERLVADRR